MAVGKLSPRQRMINMMYLVLIAMLALNVSQEVLNAFRLVSQGILQTNKSIESRNTDFYAAFEDKMADEPAETERYYLLAQQTLELRTELEKMLLDTRDEVIRRGGGWNEKMGGEEALAFARSENIDVASRYLADRESGKRGDELRDKIRETRLGLLTILDSAILDDPTVSHQHFASAISLDAQDHFDGKEVVDWKVHNFHQVPVAATHTILTKYLSDLKAAETVVLEYLFSRVGKFIPKFNELEAQVIPKSHYVTQGNRYQADIFIGASSRGQQPEVFIGQHTSRVEKDRNGEFKMILTKDSADIPLLNGGTLVTKIENGVAKYVVPGGSVGQKTYQGVIRIPDPREGYRIFPFEGEYRVAAKQVVVSPSKMNVFYVGVDNPVEISVPGVAQEDISPKIDRGRISKGGTGLYKVQCSAADIGRLARVQVSAMVEGKMVNMGTKQFRVKMIPDPKPTIGGSYTGGKISRARLSQLDGLIPDVGQFDFEAQFRVLEFSMALSTGEQVYRKYANGPVITAEMKRLIQQARPGDFVIFDGIRVMGPDGISRKLSSLSFEML